MLPIGIGNVYCNIKKYQKMSEKARPFLTFSDRFRLILIDLVERGRICEEGSGTGVTGAETAGGTAAFRFFSRDGWRLQKLIAKGCGKKNKSDETDKTHKTDKKD